MLIIYPPTVHWNYMKARPQQLMLEFARQGEEVIFCEPGEHQNRRIEKIADGLWLNYGSPPNEWTLGKGKKKVLWISYPGHVKIIDRYPKDIVVFDIIDYPGETFSAWQPFLREMLNKADIVFTVSKPLLEYYKSYHPHIYLLRNGADFGHFSSIEKLNELYDIEFISRPIVGFFGVLAPWIDWELVDELADKCSNISFVFIGPNIGVKDDELPQKANIHYLGHKDYNQLKDYITYFDICLLPFKKTQMTNCVNPVKVYEYLAAGKPVVATDIPEIWEMAPYVFQAANVETFQKGIDKYINIRNDDESKARIIFASDNTWKKRVAKAREIIKRVTS